MTSYHYVSRDVDNCLAKRARAALSRKGGWRDLAGNSACLGDELYEASEFVELREMNSFCELFGSLNFASVAASLDICSARRRSRGRRRISFTDSLGKQTPERRGTSSSPTRPMVVSCPPLSKPSSPSGAAIKDRILKSSWFPIASKCMPYRIPVLYFLVLSHSFSHHV